MLPADFAQSTFPVLSYFAIKISTPPALVNVVVPKVIVGLRKMPVIYTLPLASVEILYPWSIPVPFADFAHWQFWAWVKVLELNKSATKIEKNDLVIRQCFECFILNFKT
jgi:hypothetical protein